MPSVRYLIKLNPSSKKNSAIDLSTLFIQSAELDKVHEMKKRVSPESIYTVYLTSGTTSFPMAVSFTHFRNYNIYSQSRVPQKSDDRGFNDRSLAWGASASLVPLIYGSTNVYVHPLVYAKEREVDFCLQVR